MPEEYRLAEGETSLNPTYSLQSDGLFTLTRTVTIKNPYVGLEVSSLLEPTAQRLAIDVGSGVLVRRVDGPARSTGIQPGDVLLSIDGNTIGNADQFDYLVEELELGSEVRIEYLKKTVQVSRQMSVGETTHIARSISFQKKLQWAGDQKRSGMQLIALTDWVRPIVMGDQVQTDGLLVTSILHGGPAFFSELRLQDFIVAIDGKPLQDINDYQDALRELPPGSHVKIDYLRGQERRQTEIRLVDNARKRRKINLLGLLNYNSGPGHSRLSVVWGMIFNYNSCHDVKHITQHESKTDWGLALDLLSYEGRPSRKTMRLLWLFPLTVGS